MARTLAIETTLLERGYINPRQNPISPTVHTSVHCSASLGPAASRHKTCWRAEGGASGHFSPTSQRQPWSYGTRPCTWRLQDEPRGLEDSHQTPAILSARAACADSRHTVGNQLAVDRRCPGPLTMVGKRTLNRWWELFGAAG
jgi:hypothetical protein